MLKIWDCYYRRKVMFSVMSVSLSIQGSPHTKPWTCSPTILRPSPDPTSSLTGTPRHVQTCPTWTFPYRDPPTCIQHICWQAGSWDLTEVPFSWLLVRIKPEPTGRDVNTKPSLLQEQFTEFIFMIESLFSGDIFLLDKQSSISKDTCACYRI